MKSNLYRKRWELKPSDDGEGLEIELDGMSRYPMLKGKAECLRRCRQDAHSLRLYFQSGRVSAVQLKYLDLKLNHEDEDNMWHMLHLIDMPHQELPLPEEPTPAFRHLNCLTLNLMRALKRLPSPAAFPELACLNMYDLPMLSSLEALQDWESLTSLSLGEVSSVFDSELVRNCRNLRQLSLSDFQKLELHPEDLPALEKLCISTAPCLWTEMLHKLPRLRALSLFTLDRLENLQFLTRLPHLEELCIFGCDGLKDPEPLRALPNLRRLRIHCCANLPELVSPDQLINKTDSLCAFNRNGFQAQHKLRKRWGVSES